MLNEDTIEWLKENLSCNYQLIQTIDMIKPKEAFKYRTQNRDGSIKDPELTFNGVGYYIARNWGVLSRDEFIKLIQTKFKGMHYEIIPQAN